MKETMSQEDEIKIIREIRKGDRKAKEFFIKQNQGLVIYLAKRYAFSSDILADLIAEGNMGLLKALEKFDFKKNVKFGTYAYFWIKRFVLRAIMKEFEVLKIPERYQEFKERLEDLKKDYMFNHGRTPTDKEIAEGLKLTPEIVKKLKKYSSQVRVISSGFYDGEKEVDLFEVIDFEKSGEPGLWEVLNNRDILENIFSRLKDKEKRANIEAWINVLELYYGLGDGVQHSYKEISEKLGVSRQRVHQIKKISLRKLKKEWKEMKNEKAARLNKDNT
ncbi:MAG TPA: sigma-70 family RNA polymerase sigma factor [bacterium]|nr:sigma-70 family RNA polymerase sigma factor [bacterium]